jgi:acetyltransferase-like isoleucine patch superfamily enzyme
MPHPFYQLALAWIEEATAMDFHRAIRDFITDLARECRERFDRHVSVGDLLTNRWDTARECGFGEGTSCYDNVLILGDVKVGKNCWIGPNVVLDGQGGLVIGDNCDISAGSQIYTHHTVARCLSAGVAPIERASVKIGSRVYIGPQCVIQKGVTIGDDVVIGAMSLVTCDIPSGATAWGIPATLKKVRRT